VWPRHYCFHSSTSQAGVGLKTKKPGTFVPGFFFVAECDEISNLNLVEDIFKIIEFLDSE
jgi:hypothetical protein